MPTISIVVPVYNSAAFLGRCLDSLAAMTFQDFEVIAVDDGSKDGSWSIIQDFARRDPRFSRSFQAPHLGVGPARNLGLEIAAGEFIAFVDSDDHVDPDYCGAPYALACEQGADLVMFGSWWVYSDRLELHPPTCKEGMTPQEALLSATPMVWEKLYRRDFLRHWNLNFPAINHEDEVFMPLLLAHAPRIAVLERPLYYYLKREGSVTGLSVNPNTMDALCAFQIVVDQSRTLPQFRHELEYYAVRFLRWSVSTWATCEEDWAVDCVRRAGPLLKMIDQPGSDNPYLIRERLALDKARRRHRNVFSRLGRRVQRGVVRCLQIVSRLADGRRHSAPE